MPRRNWKNYGKRKVPSRPRTRRAPGRGGARPQNRGDIKISIGRARVWIFNNTDSEISIRPGEYIILKIVKEYRDRLGDVYRTVIMKDGGTEAQPEERPQDWV